MQNEKQRETEGTQRQGEIERGNGEGYWSKEREGRDLAVWSPASVVLGLGFPGGAAGAVRLTPRAVFPPPKASVSMSFSGDGSCPGGQTPTMRRSCTHLTVSRALVRMSADCPSVF